MDEELFLGFVFKIMIDLFVGIILFIKVNLGILKVGDEVYYV